MKLGTVDKGTKIKDPVWTLRVTKLGKVRVYDPRGKACSPLHPSLDDAEEWINAEEKRQPTPAQWILLEL